MTTKIAILGLGLIGGSLAAAFKELDNGYKVTGYNHRPAAINEALTGGIIDKGASSIGEAVADADVIFICVPVGRIAAYALEAAQKAKAGAIITDVGSTKASIVADIEPLMPPGVHFIGGHPMAGSERIGVGAANPHLFRNAHYLLAPTRSTDMGAYQQLHTLLTSIGANVLAIDPEKHDRAVAVISHLPHMVAASLMNLAQGESDRTENLLLLAAGGFKDTTRIAAGSPNMWVDICLDNKDALLYSLEKMTAMLEGLMHALEDEDRTRINDILAQAQDARINMPSALGKQIERLYELYVPVSDKPGVISDITLTVGQIGVNIEDIEILHISERSGTLRLTVPEKQNAERAAHALIEKGYEVDVRTQG
ncbi:MAG TPA: prephenate dehydrogenase [Candidatus Aquicultor sp.]|jgi:prephenate dehydrogenase